MVDQKDTKDNNRVNITPRIREKLHAHWERTHMGPHALLRGVTDKPEGLNSLIVASWLRGATNSARKAHLDFVLKRWAALPLCSQRLKSGYVPIPESTIELLKRHRERTGLGPQALLHGAEDKPEKVNSIQIQGWLSGHTRSAHLEHLAYVLERWKNMPDNESDTTAPQEEPDDTSDETGEDTSDASEDGSKEAGKRKRVELTAEIRSKLKALPAHTGVGPSRLLREAENLPEGLKPQMIGAWSNGKVRTANPEHLEFVLHAWENWPDGKRIVHISRSAFDEMFYHQERTGCGPSVIMCNAHDKPDGLRAGIIRGWLRGAVQTARKDHLSYTLERWKNLPDDCARVPITESLRAEMKRYQTDSGCGPEDVLRGAVNKPGKLYAGTIRAWLSGGSQSARRDHIDFTLARWKELSGECD